MRFGRAGSLLVSSALLLSGLRLLADEPAAPPAPPAEGEAPSPPVPPPPAAYPFEAEVNAMSVRVRAGGNINERELKVLSKGDRVTVLEEQYGWYRIACPEGCKGWVSAKYAAESAPAEGAAQTITLTGDSVQLRATDSPKGASMGSFPKETVFTVVRKRGDWFEVLCPKQASAWISAKYVGPLNGAPRPALTERPPEAAPVTPRPKDPEPAKRPPIVPQDSEETRAWKRLEAQREAMMKKSFEEIELAPLIAGYRALAEKAPNSMLSDRCKARIEELGARQRIKDQILSGIAQAKEDLQKRLDQINAEYDRKLAEIIRKHNETRSASDFNETGWVGGVGRMFGCPASHRLNKGGAHLCFLRSATDENGRAIVELERYRNQYVGVLGDRISDPEWGELIVVRDLQVLGEPAKP